jgi:Planctomycete cytochrome C
LLGARTMWLRPGLLAICVVACGGTDTRPATLEYITLTVLRPSCGLVACHAAVTNTSGYSFDTVEDSRDALRALVTPGDPDASKLIRVIRDEQSMPPDSPMFDGDISLIEQWITDGAEGL